MEGSLLRRTSIEGHILQRWDVNVKSGPVNYPFRFSVPLCGLAQTYAFFALNMLSPHLPAASLFLQVSSKNEITVRHHGFLASSSVEPPASSSVEPPAEDWKMSKFCPSTISPSSRSYHGASTSHWRRRERRRECTRVDSFLGFRLFKNKLIDTFVIQFVYNLTATHLWSRWYMRCMKWCIVA